VSKSVHKHTALRLPPGHVLSVQSIARIESGNSLLSLRKVQGGRFVVAYGGEVLHIHISHRPERLRS
jgi:hypothetical protein